MLQHSKARLEMSPSETVSNAAVLEADLENRFWDITRSEGTLNQKWRHRCLKHLQMLQHSSQNRRHLILRDRQLPQHKSEMEASAAEASSGVAALQSEVDSLVLERQIESNQ